MKLKSAARRVAACAAAVLLLAAASAKTEAKDWRRIVPLRSTRAEVERRLGKPVGGYYEFRAERAFVFYSNGGGCDGRDDWDVPRDTVVRIVVTPKRRLWLRSLRLDLRKFEKSNAPEVTSHALYADKAAGLTDEVFEGGGKQHGRILHIQFEPAAADDARARCPASG